MIKDYRKKKKSTTIIEKVGSFLLQICRYVLGGVFIFSGFVKAIDPLGFTYKIEDYLTAFGGIFGSITVIAFPAAILLSALELAIGLSLFFKIYLKQTSLLALLFMMVMLPLTLYIAIKNPVTDCGCFGDALVISNWATFYKNIVLLALVLIVIRFSKVIRPLFARGVQWVVLLLFFGIGVGLSIYCYLHQPLIDFRPYKVGANIPEGMVIPADAPTDVYITTFVYQKNGVQKEFTLDNYPKNDSTWVFVDQKSILVTKGYQPPIHNFSIVNDQFEDITENILTDKGYTYLLTMYDLSKTSHEGAKEAEIVYNRALKNGHKFYALTASSDDDVENFKRKTGVTYPFCKIDPITLKTIIRANPGLVLLKNGTVIKKWNWRDFN